MSDLHAPELSEDDEHHLSRVLRVRPGDELTVSDGAGGWRRCRFGPRLEPSGPIERDDAAHPEIAVAFALVKGERPEWVVQKLTEVGVDRIVPFVAERTVVHWDERKAVRNHARLVLVAREAAMQSRRAWLPVVERIMTFAEVATRPGAVLADRAGAPPSLRRPLVLVGPEGGWSEQERGSGLPSIGLGPHVLRAETAAIVAGAALCGLRSALFESVDGHGG